MGGQQSRGRVTAARLDWSGTRPKAVGPAQATGSYRGVLLEQSRPVQVWRCTGHPPHPSYEAAQRCARAHKGAMTSSREKASGDS